MFEGASLSGMDAKGIEQQKLKAGLIAASYAKMGYDAINVGPYDLALGVEFLKSLEKTYGLRLISTNLVDGKGRFLFPPYVIRKVGRRRVAIFGVVDRRWVAGNASVSAADPVESLRRVIGGVKGKADFFVALTQQEPAEDKRVAEVFPEIDLILRGKGSDFPREPILMGKRAIFEIGSRGQRIGTIAVDRGETGIPGWKVTEMDKEIGEDPKVRTMIGAYNSDIVRLFSLGRQGTGPLKAQACATCHAHEYAQWQKTAHAKAYASLAQVNREFDPECLRCHTTRFSAPGGFSMEEQQAGLRNVQCDVCHGDTSGHMAHPKQKRPVTTDLSICAGCHTSEHSPAFAQKQREYFDTVKHRAQR